MDTITRYRINQNCGDGGGQQNGRPGQDRL